MSSQVINLGTGKCSDFGGPDDEGVGPMEGLAMVELDDLNQNWFSRCFFPPRRGVGLARTLNPATLYCAMRWAYDVIEGKQGDILPGYSREQIRRGIFRVTAGNGRFCFVQATDAGPSRLTGRLIDLSPGALSHLGVPTDSLVTVEAWL